MTLRAKTALMDVLGRGRRSSTGHIESVGGEQTLDDTENVQAMDENWAKHVMAKMQQDDHSADEATSAGPTTIGSSSRGGSSVLSGRVETPTDPKRMTSTSNTVIIFDFDDTLFPTSALDRCRLLNFPPVKPVTPQLREQLDRIAVLACEAIDMAEKLGDVVVITNSAPGWIDYVCAQFMPTLRKRIKKVPIFAKPMTEPDGIVQVAKEPWKTKTFAKKCSVRWCTNVISVGDGASERQASMTMIEENKKNVGGYEGKLLTEEERMRGSKKFCKSLKLKGSPTMEQLIEELCLLQKRMESVVRYEGDLDLRAYFGQLGWGPTSFVYNTHVDGSSETATTASPNDAESQQGGGADTNSETEQHVSEMSETMKVLSMEPLQRGQVSYSGLPLPGKKRINGK